jgi:hypothetical protein
VVFLPGSEGRRDPERAAAARRQRERFARDVGDEVGLAWAHEPRRTRSKFTVGTAVVFVLFAGLGALPLLLGSGKGGLIQADCDTAGVRLSSADLAPGQSFSWQAAGPEAGPYLVTIDATAVTEDASGTASPSGGRVLAGPTDLTGCRSAGALSTAPEASGVHEVTLFRRTAGRWERAAAAPLTVS